MSVLDAYHAWAATYDSDRNLTRDLDAAVTRRMIDPLPATAILELGCGTGKNTQFLAGRGVPLHSLDFSEAMIAQARAKVAHDHVTFTVTDLTHPWPCTKETLDLIVCNLVLEHIADLSFIFAEAARCLAKGGHFFVSELHPFRQYLGASVRESMFYLEFIRGKYTS
jgi:predicted TPR repeat methyltransferase